MQSAQQQLAGSPAQGGGSSRIRGGGWRLTVLLGGEFRNAWMRLIDVARSEGTLQASATLEHKRIERCNRKGGQRPGCYCCWVRARKVRAGQGD